MGADSTAAMPACINQIPSMTHIPSKVIITKAIYER
jgi:hypothetical protein